MYYLLIEKLVLTSEIGIKQSMKAKHITKNNAVNFQVLNHIFKMKEN